MFEPHPNRSLCHIFTHSWLRDCVQQFSMHGLADCNNHQGSHSAVGSITTFFTSIFPKRVQVKGKKRNNAKPGLRAMHAVCPAMLGPLAFDLTSISLWPLIAGCMQLPTATAASARLCNVGRAGKFHSLKENRPIINF